MLKKTLYYGTGCLVALVAFSLVGCGGGGGGSSTPTPTRTPIPNGLNALIQLRDPNGLRVDGIVTVGSRVLATTNGDVTFTNVSSGNQTIIAEVNGRIYNREFTATPGTVTVEFVIDPQVGATPTPTSPPPPPF